MSAAVSRGDGPPMRTRQTGTGPVGAAHVPVMEGQVVGGLRPRPGARLVDGTLGLGGHAAALLAAAPDKPARGRFGKGKATGKGKAEPKAAAAKGSDGTPTAKKATAKKAAAKKTPAKKSAARKTAAKTTTARKAAPRKSTS